jgi:hypothetical protein
LNVETWIRPQVSLPGKAARRIYLVLSLMRQRASLGLLDGVMKGESGLTVRDLSRE